RNAVCGPSCGETMAVVGQNIRGLLGLPRSSFRPGELDLADESMCWARWLLPLSFPGEVFLLCTSQRLRQPRISAIVGQHQDHVRIRLATGSRNCFIRQRPLPPIRSGLEPEDDRRDIARFRGREQIAGDRRFGLGHAAIEFIAKALAQCLWRAADNLGDVVLRDPTPAKYLTFSRVASVTTNAFLAMCGS